MSSTKISFLKVGQESSLSVYSEGHLCFLTHSTSCYSHLIQLPHTFSVPLLGRTLSILGRSLSLGMRGIPSHSHLFSLSLTSSYSFGLSSSTYQNPCGQGGQGRSTRKAGGWGGGGVLEGWKQTAAAAEWGQFCSVCQCWSHLQSVPGEKFLEPVRDTALWSILF